MRRIITDGGAVASGYAKERNDCSVVAVSLTHGISYEDAYKKLEAAGRKKNGGFYMVEFFEHCNFKGYETKAIIYKKGEHLTQQEFAKKHRKGNWIVGTEGHVIAVIDGVIFDTDLKPARGKVQQAWKIIKLDKKRRK